MRKTFCLIYRMTRKRVLFQHARFMAIALHELQLQRCKVGSQQQQTAVYVVGDGERGGERVWVDSDYLNGATMRWRETLRPDSNVGDLEQYDLVSLLAILCIAETCWGLRYSCWSQRVKKSRGR